MNNAPLYASSNAFQKRDAIIILRQYTTSMIWSDDDVIMDAGCGSGDVTRNILLPHCPAFAEIVGVDQSAEMISFARDNFTHEKISYDIMDLVATKQPRNLFPQGFSKIFSFYCLHWIKNQSHALNNLYQLLNPGGCCLLVFLARNPIFDMYERQAKNKRWSRYMMDVQKFIPVHQKSTEPEEDFRQTLEECGFNVIDCVAPEFTFAFENLNYLKNAIQAVNPFISRMPSEIQEDYLMDCLQELKRMQTPTLNGKMMARYNLMIAFAEKPF